MRSTRWWVFGMLLVTACAAEPPAQDDCRCFFATQRISVRCGSTVCASGARLTCSTTEVSEEEVDACTVDAGPVVTGTRDGGTPDGGGLDAGEPDASVTMPVDAGVDVPDPPACQPTRDDCRCRIRFSSQITYIVPCCASICFESQDWAGWRCTPSGAVERVSSCE